MARVVLSRLARDDLDQIWFDIAARDADLADRISQKIEHRLGMLRRHPEMAPLRPDIASDARALLVERWLILYRHIDGEVQVGRIVDGARDLTRVALPDDR